MDKLSKTNLFAGCTNIGEGFFVAADTHWLVIMRYIILSSKWFVAMPATKVFQMPEALFCLSVLFGKNKLQLYKIKIKTYFHLNQAV